MPGQVLDIGGGRRGQGWDCLCAATGENRIHPGISEPGPFFEKDARNHRHPLDYHDRVDIALAAKADGVHLGQTDMPYDTARQLLGPDAVIGLSVETWEDVTTAQNLDLDYLGVSPVFATPTKTDTKTPWGLDGLARIRAYSRHPLVAIGGLNAANARAIIEAGANTVAVVSAICSAKDPFTAARNLVQCIDSALNCSADKETRS